MKINVWRIIVDHLGTLRNDVSKKISIADIIIFYIVPIGAGIGLYIMCTKASKDFYNASITFFGIFVALLLNFQVAAFGIYNRKWSGEMDEKISLIQRDKIEIRRMLLKQTNSNISYLILVSSIAILLFLFLYATENTGRWAVAVSWVIYIHFMLTLLMVVKRSHALFAKEYDAR